MAVDLENIDSPNLGDDRNTYSTKIDEAFEAIRTHDHSHTNSRGLAVEIPAKSIVTSKQAFYTVTATQIGAISGNGGVYTTVLSLSVPALKAGDLLVVSANPMVHTGGQSYLRALIKLTTVSHGTAVARAQVDTATPLTQGVAWPTWIIPITVDGAESLPLLADPGIVGADPKGIAELDPADSGGDWNRMSQFLNIQNFAAGLTDVHSGTPDTGFSVFYNMSLTEDGKAKTRQGSSLLNPGWEGFSANTLRSKENWASSSIDKPLCGIFDFTTASGKTQHRMYGSECVRWRINESIQRIEVLSTFHQRGDSYHHSVWNDFNLLQRNHANPDLFRTPIWYYADDGKTIYSGSLGLPEAPHFTVYIRDDQADSYLFGACYFVRTTINGKRYEFRGPVKQISTVTDFSGGGVFVIPDVLEVVILPAPYNGTPGGFTIPINSAYLYMDPPVQNQGDFSYLIPTAQAGSGSVHGLYSMPVSPSEAHYLIGIEFYRTDGTTTTLRYQGLMPYFYTDGYPYAIDLSSYSYLLGQSIYTSGGEVNNDPPPLCRFFHQTENGVAYYGHYVDESDGYIRSGWLQSKPGIVWSVPRSFGEEINEELTAISSFKGTPLMFSENKTYRIDGIIDNFGVGSISKRALSSEHGAVSHDACVQTPYGVFFLSLQGICFTEGTQVRLVTKHFQKTYQKLVRDFSTGRTCKGVFDSIKNRVLFSVNGGKNVLELSLIPGISERMHVSLWGGYTGEDNETLSNSFSAECLAFLQNRLLRGDYRGWVLWHDDNFTRDVRIVDTVEGVETPLTNKYTHIPYDLCTVFLNYDNPAVRKWTTRTIFGISAIKGDSSSQLSVEPYTLRDLKATTTTKALKPIIKDSVFWGKEDVLWGDTTLWDDETSIITATRRTPVPGIRATYRKWGIRNYLTPIARSTDYAKASQGGFGSTRTLEIVGATFPTELVDYYIDLVYFGLSGRYLIIAQPTSSKLTIQNISGGSFFANSDNINWVIRGYRKGDVISLLSISSQFDLIGTDNQEQYQAGYELANT